MSDINDAVMAAIKEGVTKQVREMDDEAFAIFVNGTVLTLEVCQKEHQRRALATQPPAGSA